MWKKKWKRGRSGNKMSYKKKISWIHVDMKIVIWLLMSWKWLYQLSVTTAHLSTMHMRKIYMGMYLYIYVNILRYVKRATSKVTLCSYEFYRKGYFSIDIIICLILVE